MEASHATMLSHKFGTFFRPPLHEHVQTSGAKLVFAETCLVDARCAPCPAAFTMFQLSTNDGWAASVVRPILDLDVFGGLLLLLYTWVLGLGSLLFFDVYDSCQIYELRWNYTFNVY